MTNLLRIRQSVHITQEELAEKSGVSVRTIQRIESGVTPKGYSLRMLAKALGVSENDLLQKNTSPIFLAEPIDPTIPIPDSYAEKEDLSFLKGLNISLLLLTFLPPMNILVPLGIIIYKKKWSPNTKLFLSIQILWLISSPLLFFILMIVFSNYISSLKHVVVPLLFILFPLINIYVTLRNAIALNRYGKMYISLKYNIL